MAGIIFVLLPFPTTAKTDNNNNNYYYFISILYTNRMNINKVFVITGGAQGIGRVLVERFAAVAGYGVSTCDVQPWPSQDNDNATTTTTSSSSSSTTIFRYTADVTQESDVAAFVQATIEHFGRIDCLINNAAISHPYLQYDDGRFENVDLKEFQRVLQTNLMGPVILTKYCTPHLRQTTGCIINLSSTRAQQSEPHSEAYAASKGGVQALTHALSISLAADGIRVNAVAPGWIHTAEAAAAEEYTPITAADDAFHPVGRVGTPDDVYEMCAFLADATKAGFITGQTLTVDGGVTRKMMYPE